MVKVTLLPHNRMIEADIGTNLLELLRRHGLAPNAPCGGQVTCGKCLVSVNGVTQKACGVLVESDLTVTLPLSEKITIAQPEYVANTTCNEIHAAIDIGTTTVVCSLLDALTGERLAVKSCSNPQAAYGADVVTRIRAALGGHMDKQTELIRYCITSLLKDACAEIEASENQIRKVIIVGNPAMQQLFLGITPENLVEIPFTPTLTKADVLPCPVCDHAGMLIVPNISGYVGADTVGCILATQMNKSDELTLMVDIGTNGELVLGNRNEMVACATAAGPALEGANIRFGMQASAGAIDHVWVEDGEIRYSTITNAPAIGICGSGLIDAVAAFLELGQINTRGRIAPGSQQDGERILPITEDIYLTQEDIRQVQLAKGAIQSGIQLMMAQMGVEMQDIKRCFLAGGFGTYLNPASACRIGLLPAELLDRIHSVGNAAILGAEMMVFDKSLFDSTTELVMEVRHLNLASLPEFPKTYAAAMRF